MSLLTIFLANQGLRFVELAARGHLDTALEAERVAKVLLPVVSRAIRQRTETVSGLEEFLLLASRVLSLTVGALVFRDAIVALALFSLVGFLFGGLQLALCIGLTHARTSVIMRHGVRHVVYAIPSVAIVALTRWGLGLSAVCVALSAALAVIPYVLFVLRSDDELRGAFGRILNKTLSVGQRWQTA